MPPSGQFPSRYQNTSADVTPATSVDVTPHTSLDWTGKDMPGDPEPAERSATFHQDCTLADHLQAEASLGSGERRLCRRRCGGRKRRTELTSVAATTLQAMQLDIRTESASARPRRRKRSAPGRALCATVRRTAWCITTRSRARRHTSSAAPRRPRGRSLAKSAALAAGNGRRVCMACPLVLTSRLLSLWCRSSSTATSQEQGPSFPVVAPSASSSRRPSDQGGGLSAEPSAPSLMNGMGGGTLSPTSSADPGDWAVRSSVESRARSSQGKSPLGNLGDSIMSDLTEVRTCAPFASEKPIPGTACLISTFCYDGP